MRVQHLKVQVQSFYTCYHCTYLYLLPHAESTTSSFEVVLVSSDLIHEFRLRSDNIKFIKHKTIKNAFCNVQSSNPHFRTVSKGDPSTLASKFDQSFRLLQHSSTSNPISCLSTSSASLWLESVAHWRAVRLGFSAYHTTITKITTITDYIDSLIIKYRWLVGRRVGLSLFKICTRTHQLLLLGCPRLSVAFGSAFSATKYLSQALDLNMKETYVHLLPPKTQVQLWFSMPSGDRKGRFRHQHWNHQRTSRKLARCHRHCLNFRCSCLQKSARPFSAAQCSSVNPSIQFTACQPARSRQSLRGMEAACYTQSTVTHSKLTSKHIREWKRLSPQLPWSRPWQGQNEAHHGHIMDFLWYLLIFYCLPLSTRVYAGVWILLPFLNSTTGCQVSS